MNFELNKKLIKLIKSSLYNVNRKVTNLLCLKFRNYSEKSVFLKNTVEKFCRGNKTG